MMNKSNSAHHGSIDDIRFLIINLHSSYNLGDHALTETTIDLLKNRFKDSTITLAMNDPESYRKEETVVASFLRTLKQISQNGYESWHIGKLIWSIFSICITTLIHRISGRMSLFLIPTSQRQLVEAYFNADIIISAPGNYLYSSGKIGLPFLVSILSIGLALSLDKPVYMLPQSIGPLTRKWEKWLIKSVLSRSRLVMMREPISYSLLKDLGFKSPQCIVVPDLAFLYHAQCNSGAQEWLESFGVDWKDNRPILGITLVDLDRLNFDLAIRENYEQSIAEAIEQFIKNDDGKIVFFAQACGSPFVADDRVPMERILSLIPECSDAITLMDNLQSASIQKSAYGLMDIFLGTRMHSNIFAMTEGVPSLAIAYFPKTKGIMEMLGLERWIIDVQEINPSNLYEQLQELWKNRNKIKMELEFTVTHSAREAAKAIELIADDFEMLDASKKTHE